MDTGLLAVFQRLKDAARGLPDIVETTSYGTPALKAGKKLLTRVKDGQTAVLMCPLDEKQMLLEAAPDLYFETDHYKGWPALLMRMDVISDDELRHRLERSWLSRATKTQAKAWLAGREKTSEAP